MSAPRHTDRYSPETAASDADGRLFSPSFDRNYEPVRDTLGPLLAGRSGTALEIGAGTGQHVAHLARSFPDLQWVPSDFRREHLESIAAWRAHLPSDSLAEPLELDASTAWNEMPEVEALGPLSLVFAMNVIHIAPWRTAEGLVAGARQALGPDGLLVLYGPFRVGGRHVSESNERFDEALRASNPEWGVRDLDDVAALSREAGFARQEVMEMPSNNRLVAFSRG